MTVESGGADSHSLAWRIPTTQEWVAARTGWMRWFITLVVFSLIITIIWPADTKLLAFLAAVPLLAALWWWLIIRPARSANQEPNIWLDDAGLHWLDSKSKRHTLPRAGLRSFAVGSAGARPEFHLILTSGFISQPVMPHAPVSAAMLRGFLSQEWGLEEQDWSPALDLGNCLGRLAIASDMRNADRGWDLEGTPADLGDLALFLERAAQTSLPPVGVRPRAQHIVATRPEEHTVWLLVDQITLLGYDSLSAPPVKFHELAERLRAEQATHIGAESWTFDWPTDDGVWTITLHVMEDDA